MGEGIFPQRATSLKGWFPLFPNLRGFKRGGFGQKTFGQGEKFTPGNFILGIKGGGISPGLNLRIG